MMQMSFLDRQRVRVLIRRLLRFIPLSAIIFMLGMLAGVYFLEWYLAARVTCTVL